MRSNSSLRAVGQPERLVELAATEQRLEDAERRRPRRRRRRSRPPRRGPWRWRSRSRRRRRRRRRDARLPERSIVSMGPAWQCGVGPRSQAILRKTAAKKPSMPSGPPSVRRARSGCAAFPRGLEAPRATGSARRGRRPSRFATGPSTSRTVTSRKAACSARKAASIAFPRWRETNTSRRRGGPPGATSDAAARSSPACDASRRGTSSRRSRQRASGLRRIAPRPVQGASTSTRARPVRSRRPALAWQQVDRHRLHVARPRTPRPTSQLVELVAGASRARRSGPCRRAAPRERASCRRPRRTRRRRATAAAAPRARRRAARLRLASRSRPARRPACGTATAGPRGSAPGPRVPSGARRRPRRRGRRWHASRVVLSVLTRSDTRRRASFMRARAGSTRPPSSLHQVDQPVGKREGDAAGARSALSMRRDARRRGRVVPGASAKSASKRASASSLPRREREEPVVLDQRVHRGRDDGSLSPRQRRAASRSSTSLRNGQPPRPRLLVRASDERLGRRAPLRARDGNHGRARSAGSRRRPRAARDTERRSGGTRQLRPVADEIRPARLAAAPRARASCCVASHQ